MKQKIILFLIILGLVISSTLCGYALFDGFHSGSVYDIIFRSSSHSLENSYPGRYALKATPFEYWVNIGFYFVFFPGGLWSAYYLFRVSRVNS
jgi:hypothetical protein